MTLSTLILFLFTGDDEHLGGAKEALSVFTGSPRCFVIHCDWEHLQGRSDAASATLYQRDHLIGVLSSPFGKVQY